MNKSGNKCPLWSTPESAVILNKVVIHFITELFIRKVGGTP